MDLDGAEFEHGYQPQATIVTSIFDKLQGYIKFKENFQHVSIRVRKDLDQKWHDLPCLATDDAIDVVLD